MGHGKEVWPLRPGVLCGVCGAVRGCLRVPGGAPAVLPGGMSGRLTRFGDRLAGPEGTVPG